PRRTQRKQRSRFRLCVLCALCERLSSTSREAACDPNATPHLQLQPARSSQAAPARVLQSEIRSQRSEVGMPLSPVAVELVQLSALAYGPSAIAAGTEHVAIRQRNGEIFLAFRGTASLEQWAEDADCLPLHFGYGPGFVHEGFARALERAMPTVQALLPAAAIDHRPVIHVGGHSLGAGLATLFAIYLLQYPAYQLGEVH